MSSSNPYTYSLNMDENFPEKPLFKSSIKPALTLGLCFIICTSLTLLFLSNSKRFEVISSFENTSFLFDHKKNLFYKCQEEGCHVVWHPALEESLLSALGIQQNQPPQLSHPPITQELPALQEPLTLKSARNEAEPLRSGKIETGKSQPGRTNALEEFDKKTKEVEPPKLYGDSISKQPTPKVSSHQNSRAQSQEKLEIPSQKRLQESSRNRQAQNDTQDETQNDTRDTTRNLSTTQKKTIQKTKRPMSSSQEEEDDFGSSNASDSRRISSRLNETIPQEPLFDAEGDTTFND